MSMIFTDNNDGMKRNWGEDGNEKADESKVQVMSKRYRRNALVPNGVEAEAAREVSSKF